MENLEFKQKLAEYLLQIKAIHFNLQNPYTWASGWKSPMYCDNRLILSYPDVRNFVRDGLVQMVQAYFPDADCIAGVATAGIPHATMIADHLNLPLIYVRSKPKEHGRENLIEGELKHGMRVVVIEDTISTGGSSLQAVEALRKQGAEVVGMCAIYKYGFDVARKRFEESGVTLKTLTNYDYVLRAGIESNYIDDVALVELKKWVSQPDAWNK
ncbi:MAG: orotate phosphoribosyltransferase [Bacteroidetes bacterium]|nr:orotate phosphoribosyltransferase [Bacteroidota bacterium]MCB0513478.1 orotate phosphoribosyltransferase [Bacteroidota bacterium]